MKYSMDFIKEAEQAAYYVNDQKDELDRRTRFGELVYVDDYTHSDETKVKGYYRRYPSK